MRLIVPVSLVAMCGLLYAFAVVVDQVVHAPPQSAIPPANDRL